MNIAIGIDDKFLMPAGVFYTSLLNNNKNVNLFVISTNLSESSKESLQAIANKFNSNLTFCFFDKSIINYFPVRKQDHISLATYYRLLLPKILPESMNKILYLDCDMIVNNNIDFLWNTNIKNYSCAASPDMYYDSESITKRLGYSVTEHYFNAGMLLINLDYWRINKISEKTIAYISDYPEKCIAHDQDAINAVLQGTIKTVSASYNIQQDFLRKDLSILEVKDEKILNDIKNCINNPYIIHYTGPSKPWTFQCVNPYKFLWNSYQRKTQWKNLSKENEFSGKRLIDWYKQRIKEILHLIPLEENKYISL